MNGVWNVSHFRDRSAGVSSGAMTAANQAARTAVDIEERLDKLMLINMAMWELIRDRSKLTEADLLAKVQELDLRDGVPDGKMTRTVSKCSKCDRTMSPRHQSCMYCGADKLHSSVFDGI